MKLVELIQYHEHRLFYAKADAKQYEGMLGSEGGKHHRKMVRFHKKAIALLKSKTYHEEPTINVPIPPVRFATLEDYQKWEITKDDSLIVPQYFTGKDVTLPNPAWFTAGYEMAFLVCGKPTKRS